MRAQTSQGHQVYIFHGDSEMMMRNHSIKWSLYGLWTHSASPVVQYVCTDEDDREFGGKAKLLGIELLGHCIAASTTTSRADNSLGRQLVIYNDGNILKAELFDGSQRLSPARNCSIKQLPMKSPFEKLLPSSVPRSHERESSRRRARDDETTNSRRREASRQTTGPQTNTASQWYTTKTGEEKLRGIQDYCTQKFYYQDDKVVMSRDPSSHDLQLTIHHNNQTFIVDFPDDFPAHHAQFSLSSLLNPTVPLRRNDEIRNGEDIVTVVRNYCACYRCKYS